MEMVTLQVIGFNGTKNVTEAGSIELPKQFHEEINQDLIARAVLAVQANKRQHYGVNELAGKKYSAKISRRRRNFKGAYGKGISRVPRKTVMRRGSQFVWVGALASGTVGGKTAHPPLPETVWAKKVNKKNK